MSEAVLYLHGRLPTPDAETLLRKYGAFDGLFLVRKNRRHQLVLSVCFETILHLVIGRDDKTGLMTICGHPCIDSENLPMLIDNLHDPAYAKLLSTKAHMLKGPLTSAVAVVPDEKLPASVTAKKGKRHDYINIEDHDLAVRKLSVKAASLSVNPSSSASAYVNMDEAGAPIAGHAYVNCAEDGRPIVDIDHPYVNVDEDGNQAIVGDDNKKKGYVNVEDYEELNASQKHVTLERDTYKQLTTAGQRKPPLLTREESLTKMKELAMTQATRFHPPVPLTDPLLNGIFLIRRSASKPQDFVLDVLYSGKALHYQIAVAQSPYAVILDPASSNSRRFPHLDALVAHFQKTPDNIKCKLTLEVKV